MSKKKDIIRVGDKVRILRPNFIYKWGYENNLQDTAREVAKVASQEVHNLVSSVLEKMGVQSHYDFYHHPHHNTVNRIMKGLAYEVVHKRKRTGNIRKLFYTSDPHYDDDFHPLYLPSVGYVGEVREIKIAKTGKYFPPSYDPEDGDCCEYGGLSEEKTHKLLGIAYFDTWIEVIDVEKVYEENP